MKSMDEDVSSEGRAQPRLNQAALSMLVVALVAFAAPIWYWASTTENDAYLAFLILVLPSVLVAVGATNLLLVDQKPPLLTICLLCFEAAKSLLLVFYIVFTTKQNLNSETKLTILSVIALGVGWILVFLVFRLTAWIMRHTVEGDDATIALPTSLPKEGTQAQSNREGVIQQLLKHRFLSICGLLLAFLYLTIFLAFSIAFHDRAWAERLQQANAPASLSLKTTGVRSGLALKRVLGRLGRLDLQYESAIKERDATEAISTTNTASVAPTRGADRNVFFLTFQRGSASLQCSDAVLVNVDQGFFTAGSTQTWRVKYLSDHGVLTQLSDRGLAPSGCQDEIQEIAWNVNELRTIKATLGRLYEQDSFDRYRALVISHATKDEPRSGFGSNYEISRARAEQTEELIESFLVHMQDDDKSVQHAPLNIEWLLLPAGSGTRSLFASNAVELGRLMEEKSLNHNLSVELELVRIPRHLTALQRRAFPPSGQLSETRNLTLLDYLYFMITTAGYGDLMPATGFVEFVASIANIFELFFLVVAFNVILAFRREPIFRPAPATALSPKPATETSLAVFKADPTIPPGVQL